MAVANEKFNLIVRELFSTEKKSTVTKVPMYTMVGENKTL